MSETPMSEMIRISDFKFPSLDLISDCSVMSNEKVLMCYKSSVKRLIHNSEIFLNEIDDKLDSISGNSSDI